MKVAYDLYYQVLELNKEFSLLNIVQTLDNIPLDDPDQEVSIVKNGKNLCEADYKLIGEKINVL